MAEELAKTPSFTDWLNSPEAMALAGSLLRSSGPSPHPTSLGQAIGVGIGDMMNAQYQFGNQNLEKNKFAYQQERDAKEFALRQQDSQARVEDRKALAKFREEQANQWRARLERQQRADDAFANALSPQMPSPQGSSGVPPVAPTPFPAADRGAAPPSATLLNPSDLGNPSPGGQAASQPPTPPQQGAPAPGLLNTVDPRKAAIAKAYYYSGKPGEAYKTLFSEEQKSWGRPFATKDANGNSIMATIDSKTGQVKVLEGIKPPEASGLFVQTPDGLIISQGKPSEVQQIMSKPSQKTVGDLQESIGKSLETMGDLDQVASKYADNYLTYGGKTKRWTSREAEKLGLGGLVNKEFLGEATKFKTTVDQFFNQYRKDITGAAASVQELDRLKESIFNSDMSPTEFKASFGAFREKLGRGLALKQQLLREGIPAGSKRFTEELDNRYFQGPSTESKPQEKAIGPAAPASSPKAEMPPPLQPTPSQVQSVPAAELKKEPEQRAPSPLLQEAPQVQPVAPEPSLANKVVSGVGRGLKDFGQGIKQTALEAGEMVGLSNPGRAKEYTQEVEKERKAFADSPVGQSYITKAGQFAGNVAPWVASSFAAAPLAGAAGVARGAQALKGAYPLLARALGMGATGAAAGGTSFIPEGQSRATNAAMGGTFGAAFPMATSVASKAGKGLLSFLEPKIGETASKGVIGGGLGAGAGYGLDKYKEASGADSDYTAGLGLLGAASPLLARGAGATAGKLYNAFKGVPSTPEQKAVIELGKQFDVPVFAADITPKGGFVDKLTKYAEDVPFAGVTKARNAQMDAAQSAAEGLTDKLKDQMLSTNFGGKAGLRRLEQVAQGNSIRASKAREILNDIKNAGDDWNAIMKVSGNFNLFRSKLIGDKKFDKVSHLADQYGPVDKKNAIEAVTEAIKENAESFLPDKGLAKQLEDIMESLQSKELNYSQMREARSSLSRIIDDYYKGANAAVGSKGVGIIQKVKGAFEKDMNQFAQEHGPELRTAWKNADHFYQKKVVPFKTVELAKAMTTAPVDEIYSKFIKVGGAEGDKGTGRAKQFYDALDDKGRSAVRYGMIKHALEKGINPGEKGFSPAQFASEIEKYGAAKGVFFKGAAKLEVNGFTNLMRHIERAAQMNKPDTGIRLSPNAVGASYVGGVYLSGAGIPGAVAAYLAGTYGLKKLLTTEAGRNLMISSSRLNPGSPQMESITTRLLKLLESDPAQRGIVAGAAIPPSPNDKKKG